MTLLLLLRPVYEAGTDHTLWPDTTVPGTPAADDPLGVEVGVKFTTSVNGWCTGLRFYKDTGNTGTHVGHLWTSAGVSLGSVTFTGETATGWQIALFDDRVAVTTGTTYVASYFAPFGRYAVDSGYFATDWVAAPLTAPNGSNGVYTYTSTPAFPTSTFGNANYWVTPIVNTTTAPTTTPVGQTRDVRWPVRAVTSPTADIRWQARYVAGATGTGQWGARALAGRTATDLWPVRALATQTRDVRWQAKAVAGATADARWLARYIAGRTADTRWGIHYTTGRTRDARWPVRALADPVLDVRWQTKWVAGSTADARWQTRWTAGQAVDLQWRAYILAGQPLDLRWQTVRTSLTIWPDTHGWTATRDSRRTVSALSTDYVRIDVVPPPKIDPRSAGVEAAIVPIGSEPAAGDWRPASWWHDDVDPLAWRTWTALALVGPNSSLPLSPGTYGVWLRIDSSTVTPPVRDVRTVIEVSALTVD